MFKNMSKGKKTLVWVAGVFLFLIILGSILPKSPTNSSPEVTTEETVTVEKQDGQKAINDAKVRMNDKTVLFTKIVKEGIEDQKEHDAIVNDLKNFQNDFINDSTILASAGVDKELKAYRVALVNVLKTFYPIAREKYAESRKDELWKIDGAIDAIGLKNEELQVTSRDFAANANKLKALEALTNVVYEYRFKQVNLRWFSYDNGTTWEYNYDDSRIKSYN